MSSRALWCGPPTRRTSTGRIPVRSTSREPRGPLSRKRPKDRSSGPSEEAARSGRTWLLFVLVGIVTLLVYLPSLGNGFVDWDDDKNLLDNLAYRGLGPAQLEWMWTTFHLGPYQPLSWMSYGVDYLLWGMKPFGYHLTAILLHALSAAFFAALAARLFAEDRGAKVLGTEGRGAEVRGAEGRGAVVRPGAAREAWTAASFGVLA